MACKVYGIGTVKLKRFDDHNFFLCNVRYVPELKHKFFLIRMFEDLGY